MTEIQYEPTRKIVIHEVIKYGLDEFTNLKAIQSHPQLPQIPLRWTDGIVFDFIGMPPTPELVNDQAKNGTIHWAIIEWAEMPEFQNALVHPTTSATRRIINGSSNTAVRDAIRWLKNQPQWKDPAEV